MFWTGWNDCTGGHGMQPKECTIGYEKRQKAVCCPRNNTNETTDETFLACKINCNMTDDDFEELRLLTTTVPPTTHRVPGLSHSTTGTTSRPGTQRTRTITVVQGGTLHSVGNGTTNTGNTKSGLSRGTLHSVGNGTTNTDNTKSGLSTEEIAIIAAAGVAALACLACFLIALLCKRNKRKKPQSEHVRETLCSGWICPVGTTCYLSLPCPAHYMIGCIGKYPLTRTSYIAEEIAIKAAA
uniref:Uncharacterized protein n=1 Tax=Magallana gigas TaxID=29159 RepID=K1RJ15_MAGGI